MSIYFSNSEIQIYRFRQVGSNSKWTLSATFTPYDADIQPASTDRVELASGQIGHLFTAFVDVDVQIREGDELRIIGDTKKYSVKGINRWQGAGILDHLELTLVAEDDNS